MLVAVRGRTNPRRLRRWGAPAVEARHRRKTYMAPTAPGFLRDLLVQRLTLRTLPFRASNRLIGGLPTVDKVLRLVATGTVTLGTLPLRKHARISAPHASHANHLPWDSNLTAPTDQSARELALCIFDPFDFDLIRVCTAMSAEALYVLQHAGLLSINAIPGGRVGCHGQGGPFAQFFVRTSPADPTIIQFVPGKEPARCLRVVQTPEGALTLDALAVSPCHSPEGWFQLRIPSDGTPLRFGVCAAAHLESVLLPGHYLLASQDGRVLLVGGSAGATTFAIRSAAEAAPSPALVGARGGGFRLGVQRNLAAHAVAGGGGGGGVGAMAGLRGMLARVGLGRGGRGGRGGASARHQHAPRGPAVSTIAPRPLPPALKVRL